MDDLKIKSDQTMLSFSSMPLQELMAKKRKLQHKRKITMEKISDTQDMLKEGRIWFFLLPCNSKEIEKKLKNLYQAEIEHIKRLNRIRAQIKLIEEQVTIIKEQTAIMKEERKRAKSKDSATSGDSEFSKSTYDSAVEVQASSESNEGNNTLKLVDRLRGLLVLG